MEFRHSNLHTRADSEVQSLGDCEGAHDDSGGQENLFFSIQGAA
jgi:hypothetical protein